MSFWATPVGIILPIVLQPLLIAICRFFIIKKPLPVKKAKVVTIIYTIATSSLVTIISSDSFFVSFTYLFLWPINCRLLAGWNQNILSKRAQKYFERARVRARISVALYLFLLFILWIVSAKSTAHLLLRLTIPFAALLFFLFKYRQIEDDVESAREWQEKLDRERVEREQKEKDLKDEHSDS